MALPNSGKMTMTMITTEFKAPAASKLSDFYRGGQYVRQNNIKIPTSGPIKFSDFYGATSMLVIVHDVRQDSLFLDINLILAVYQWDGITPVDLTINVAPGVVIYSNNTARPALHIAPIIAESVVRINNSGYIIGMGGAGGRGQANQSSNGHPGGNAILIEEATIINNLGTIGGGGGGGAGARVGVANWGGGGGQTGRVESLGGYVGTTGYNQNGRNGTFASGGWAPGEDIKYGRSGASWGQTAGNSHNNNGIGGAGGKALVGNDKVTWINQGIIAGSIV